MWTGYEATSKSVRTLLPAVLSVNVVLMNSLANLYTLGVGQAPRPPGETPCGDQRDLGENQGKR